MRKNSQVKDDPSREIKKALIDHRLTVTGLARRISKSRTAVSMAIHHPTILPAVRRSIHVHLQLSDAN